MDEEDNIEDYLERALTVNRRSVFYIDENLQDISKELFENLGTIVTHSNRKVGLGFSNATCKCRL